MRTDLSGGRVEMCKEVKVQKEQSLLVMGLGRKGTSIAYQANNFELKYGTMGSKQVTKARADMIRLSLREKMLAAVQKMNWGKENLRAVSGY